MNRYKIKKKYMGNSKNMKSRPEIQIDAPLLANIQMFKCIAFY